MYVVHFILALLDTAKQNTAQATRHISRNFHIYHPKHLSSDLDIVQI